MEKVKYGDSIFLLFRDGTAVLDGALKPQVYRNEEHYRKHKRRYNNQAPGDQLVEYRPARNEQEGT